MLCRLPWRLFAESSGLEALEEIAVPRDDLLYLFPYLHALEHLFEAFHAGDETLAEPKKPLSETVKKEEKKTDISQFNISKVSIIEAKSKAMLVINITNPNGSLDYGDEIESKYGKEWLKLRINPAVNSTDKSFKFTSAYIGEMRIEEDKTGGQNLVNIFIELIPSGVTYDIARIKNTLVLTFSNP